MRSIVARKRNAKTGKDMQTRCCGFKAVRIHSLFGEVIPTHHSSLLCLYFRVFRVFGGQPFSCLCCLSWTSPA